MHELLKASPNLYNISIAYKTLQPLLDDESVCRLLGERITHLHITVHTESGELPTISMTHLISVFSRLKHLCFDGGLMDQFSESLILTALSHLPQWNSLVSLSVVNLPMTPEICTKGIHQWVLENIPLSTQDSFICYYASYTFRLWL